MSYKFMLQLPKDSQYKGHRVVVVDLITDDQASIGCFLEEVRHILTVVDKMGMNVDGVFFNLLADMLESGINIQK
jgi:hypothetical protein